MTICESAFIKKMCQSIKIKEFILKNHPQVSLTWPGTQSWAEADIKLWNGRI